MAQINHPAPIGPYFKGFDHASRRSSMFGATIGLTVALLLALTLSFLTGRAQPSDTAALSNAAVVDGWMPGITAASRERAAASAGATRDGWSSYLLVSEPPVVDGWAARYLVSEPPVVDGWAARYLVSDDE